MDVGLLESRTVAEEQRVGKVVGLENTEELGVPMEDKEPLLEVESVTLVEGESLRVGEPVGEEDGLGPTVELREPLGDTEPLLEVESVALMKGETLELKLAPRERVN